MSAASDLPRKLGAELEKQTAALANIGPMEGRRKSVASLISFRTAESAPTLGRKRGNSYKRRERSPPPSRFTKHIAFGNLDAGEPTKNNVIGLTLQSRHTSFVDHKLSRTFLVGLDNHDYSEDAVTWLMEAMVEEGDTVVCVRVHEKDAKPTNETVYQRDARKLLGWVESQNRQNKGIRVVLEYVFGKLTDTFRHLLNVHQPGMVIVGTKGKTGQGLQGVWNSRNSFSKYCLQYSPVPVIVVRPDSKRQSKKDKRQGDSGRQGYSEMVKNMASGQHELNIDLDTLDRMLQTQGSPDEEAHQVAKALGLPAIFDPTIKAIDPDSFLSSRRGGGSKPSSRATSMERQPSKLSTSVTAESTESDSETDSADSPDDGQQEQEHEQQNARLHVMEMDEAQIFKRGIPDDESNDIDDDTKEDSA